MILKVNETDSEDEEAYTSVENEKTLQTVFNIFREKFKDEFNFTDWLNVQADWVVPVI